MRTFQEYRQHAIQCRRLAALADVPEDRETILQMLNYGTNWPTTAKRACATNLNRLKSLLDSYSDPVQSIH
jgi:hypothetical protein